ncbi:MAG: PEP-CTERM sorting domain-containing protein [Anaerolineae bacterium]
MISRSSRDRRPTRRPGANALRVAFVACGALLAIALLIAQAFLAPASSSVSASPAAQADQWRTYANGDDLWSMALEGSNILWTGTRGGGVVAWDLSDLTNPKPTQYLAPQDPLAGNFVRAVAIDGRGTKWFGTERGLTRLKSDGSWTSYTMANTSNGLPSNVVTALAVQDDRYLWVGTQQYWSIPDKKFLGGGIARADMSVDPPTWTVWNTYNNQSVPSNNVTDIAVDTTSAANQGKGDVWITMRTDLMDAPPDQQQQNIYFQQRYGGITVIHPDGSVEKFQQDINNVNSWPKYASLLTVAVDPTGLKWFGTGDLTSGGNGFHVMKGNTLANAQWKGYTGGNATTSTGLTPIPSLPANANRFINITMGATTAERQDVWLSLADVDAYAAYDGGLGVCQLAWYGWDSAKAPTCTNVYDVTGGAANRPLAGNLVRAIVRNGAAQAIYFGTSGRLPAADTSQYPQGTDGHGIQVFSEALDTVLTTTAAGISPASNHINAVSYQQDNTVWVGNAYPSGTSDLWGGAGVDHLKSDGKTWEHLRLRDTGTQISSAVSSLGTDARGRLLIGLLPQQLTDRTTREGGFATVAGDTLTYYNKDNTGGALQTNSVSTLALTADGNRAYLGTGNDWPDPHDAGTGAPVFDAQHDVWVTTIKPPDLLDTEISKISITNDQTWIANTWPSSRVEASQRTGGVSGFQGTQLQQTYAVGNNSLTLSNSDPRAVYMAPDGTLWVGGYFTRRPTVGPTLSDAAISWLPSGQQQFQTVTFADDGWVSAIVSRQGAIWVGTTRGGQNIEDIPTRLRDLRTNQYAAQGGLRVYANGQWSLYTPDNSPLVSGHINALTVDTANNLWIGTSMGLMRYSGGVPSTPVVPATPGATFTPRPSSTPTASPTPTNVAVNKTPDSGGHAPTMTPAIPTPTPTPFPGSPPPEIPEASTLLLMGGGLAGLVGYLRYLRIRRRP